MHASAITPTVVKRANELYWGSDRSVNQIADDLELSKGALYGIIEPEASGLGCPLCGDEVVYSNRTAKDKKMLDCPTCDWDGAPDETVAVDETVAEGRDAEGHGADGHGVEGHGADGHGAKGPGAGRNGAQGKGAAAAPAERSGTAARARDDGDVERIPPRPFIRPAPSTVAGGALIGAAVGLALVMWARRR